MPSLLGNLKLDTPVVARQPKVKHLHGYPCKWTRYCRVAWLPNKCGRMVTWILSALKYCCMNVSCIATNSGKASVSIATARCYKGKAIHNASQSLEAERVSLWKRS
jgi:hypothetical protein